VGLVPQSAGANLQLADRILDSDVYRGPILACRYNVLRRGTFGSGFRLGWVCTSSRVEREPGGKGILTINWELGGPYANPAYLPLDDFREETVELYPKVERHSTLAGADVATRPTHRIAPYTIALAYGAHTADSQLDTNQPLDTIYGMYDREDDPPGDSTWAEQKAWGLKLYKWLGLGHETYYLAGIKYSWITHSFVPPEIEQGAFIESPQGGPLMGDTTFSWLRLADVLEPAGVNGSVYKLTSTWLGGPGGHWDPDLYPTA
jgi:hypothetical protein